MKLGVNGYFLFLLGSRRSLGNAKMALQFLVEFVILTPITRFNKVYRIVMDYFTDKFYGRNFIHQEQIVVLLPGIEPVTFCF